VSVDEALSILHRTLSVLVIDWPSADVPDSLARAGFRVTVKSGPGPSDYARREWRDGAIVRTDVGAPPDHVDLVYAHRPLSELPAQIELAKQLGALAIWRQSGLSGPDKTDPQGCWVPEEQSRAAREMVEAEAMRYVDGVYIGDAARTLQAAARQARIPEQ
jgi:hypothetical protein